VELALANDGMGKLASLRRTFERAIWLGAGFGLWLYLVNRFILHWSNSTLKAATMAVLALGLCGLAWVARLHRLRALWHALALVLLGAFSVGELHRAWLRYECRGRAEETGSAQGILWTHPWTTTDLFVRRRVLSVPREVGRVRIAHLTDLHIAPSISWDYYESIVERTNAEAPDVIVLTGDYLSKAEYLPLFRRWLILPLRARLGVYAVLGNHDYWANVADEVRQALVLANVHVLSGECNRLTGGAEHVVLCGTDAPWGSDYSAPPVAPDDFVVALSHTPDNIYSLRGRAHAVFAGHYHGGQWRIPVVGALIVPSVFGRRFDHGDFFVDGTELFVSPGVGADYPPLRVYCQPELLLVDLVGTSEAIAAGLAGQRGSRRID
jgi:uncharacterized protein